MAKTTEKTDRDYGLFDFDVIHYKGGAKEKTTGEWELIDDKDGLIEAAFYFKPVGEAHKESIHVFWTARQARQIAYMLLMYANQAEE